MDAWDGGGDGGMVRYAARRFVEAAARTSDARYTDSEQNAIRSVNLVASILSTIGSLFIVVCFVYLKRTKQVPLRLVCGLSVADVLSLIPTYLDAKDPGDNTGCKVLGFFVQFGDLIPILWTSCISFHLYCSIFKKRKRDGKFITYYTIFCLLVSLVMALIVAAFDGYGDAEGICWVKNVTLRLMVLYVPLWLVLAFNTVVYFMITKEYNRIFRRHSLGKSNQLYRLKLYPLVLLGCWLLGTIARIVDIFAEAPFELLLPAFGLSKAQGLFNALVYGMDPLLFKELKTKLQGRALEPRGEEDDIEDGTSTYNPRSESQPPTDFTVDLGQPSASAEDDMTEGDLENENEDEEEGTGVARATSNTKKEMDRKLQSMDKEPKREVIG